MPTIDENLRKRLMAKYGPDINLEASSTLIADLLREIAQERAGSIIEKPGDYDKTYSEGYNKEGYEKANYNKYDKTYVVGDEIEQVILGIRPELEEMIRERLMRLRTERTEEPNQ